jgi:hypothetical protein
MYGSLSLSRLSDDSSSSSASVSAGGEGGEREQGSLSQVPYSDSSSVSVDSARDDNDDIKSVEDEREPELALDKERGRDLGGESVSLLLFLRASPLIKAM